MRVEEIDFQLKSILIVLKVDGRITGDNKTQVATMKAVITKISYWKHLHNFSSLMDQDRLKMKG
jgi:hypothetical protein